MDTITTTIGAEQLRELLRTAIQGAPAGTPAQVQIGEVTISVYGASRARQDWPQVTAQITITTPDGQDRQVAGEDITSWADLAARVEAAASDWRVVVDGELRELLRAHRALVRAEQAVTQARARRDQVIRAAAARGVTSYRVAKLIRVAESTVGRIVGRG